MLFFEKGTKVRDDREHIIKKMQWKWWMVKTLKNF